MASDSKELTKTRFFTFERDAGKRYVGGRTYWPTFLRLRMTREQAFGLAMNVLRQYELPSADRESPVEVSIPGALARDRQTEAELRRREGLLHDDASGDGSTPEPIATDARDPIDDEPDDAVDRGTRIPFSVVRMGLRETEGRQTGGSGDAHARDAESGVAVVTIETSAEGARFLGRWLAAGGTSRTVDIQISEVAPADDRKEEGPR